MPFELSILSLSDEEILSFKKLTIFKITNKAIVAENPIIKLCDFGLFILFGY